MEPFNFQMVRQSLPRGWPIEQFTIWPKSRLTNARSIRGNYSDHELARGRFGQLRHCSRARPAMAKENRNSITLAVLGIGEMAAVLQQENFSFSIHDCRLIFKTNVKQNPLSGSVAPL